MSRLANLKPLINDHERAVALGKMGGVASGAARRRKRLLRDTVEAFLAVGGDKEGTPNSELIFGKKLMALARKGDIRAMELIARLTGEIGTGAAGGRDEEEEEEAAAPAHKIVRLHAWLSWQFQSGGNYAFMYGTTRSGKTYAICQWLCERLAGGELRGQILICGQTVPFLRNGCASYLSQIAPAYGLTVMDNGLKIQGNNGVILLQSFDKPERVLSAQWSFVFVNEGNVIPQQIIDGLSIRCSGLVLADFNPSVADWWGKPLMTETNSLLCSFKDNPYLSETQLSAIEAIRERGESSPYGSYANWYYHVYYLGEFAEAGGGVFTRLYRGTEADWEALPLPTFHGIDFGDTQDPNALVAFRADPDTRKIHIRCQLYETGVDDQRLAKVLEAAGVRKLVFETATGGNTRAKNIRIFGYTGDLYPCVKENVAQSVFNLSTWDIVCYDDTSFGEFKGYRLDGGKFKGADHCIDAVRYVAGLVLTNRITEHSRQ